MIEIRLREAVILASDFTKLVEWYKRVLGFKEVRLFDDDYHYCNLETQSGIKIGIADAEEMGVAPVDRHNNTVILQFEVDELQELFAHLEQNGATIIGGCCRMGPAHIKEIKLATDK